MHSDAVQSLHWKKIVSWNFKLIQEAHSKVQFLNKFSPNNTFTEAWVNVLPLC